MLCPLFQCAAPLRWVAADGRPVEMDSLQTARARHLRDIYTELIVFEVDKATRRRVLETLRLTVQEQRCQLTQDLIELIDREQDLMSRSVKASSLEGLRTRITTLFLQYIKTPAFNPEVVKYLKVIVGRGGQRSCSFSSSSSSDPSCLAAGAPELRPAAQQHVIVPQLQPLHELVALPPVSQRRGHGPLPRLHRPRQRCPTP